MGKLNSRREQILRILEKKQLTTVAELSEQLEVTTETIRKDLLCLEHAGKIVRIHGGRRWPTMRRILPLQHPQELKQQRKAESGGEGGGANPGEGQHPSGEQYHHGGSVSCSLLERPELLKTLTVVTNSFYIAQCLKSGQLCMRLLFLGGWVSETEASTLGTITTDMMQLVRVNKAFLSGAALNRKLELTAFYERDMLFQQKALEHADETILLLDSTKYPASGVLAVALVKEFSCLVSDISFPKEQLESIRDSGVLLVKA